MAAALAIGVIGAGQVAERHVAAYRANPSTRVAVIVDPALERAQALAQTCDAGVAASYEDVLARGGLDAVSVCVPHDLHFPVAQAAAAAGVHMLMEKPIANTLEEADAIVELVERSGVRLMIGFVHRFRTEVQEARRLLSEGAIGTPSTALDRFCSLGGPHPPAWVWRKQRAGGGVLMYGGIHAIDRLLWLLGTRVTSVSARWHHTYGDGDVEDGLVAMLDLANGVTAVLFENSPPFGRPGGWCTELFGSEGAVRIQTGEWVELTANSRRLRVGSLDEMHFQREIDEFVASVLEDREPSVPAAAGRDSLEVALAIYRSAAEGTRVDLGAGAQACAGVTGPVGQDA